MEGSSAVGVTPSPCILWQMVGGCCCCPSLVEYPGPEEVCCACRVLLFPAASPRHPPVLVGDSRCSWMEAPRAMRCLHNLFLFPP